MPKRPGAFRGEKRSKELSRLKKQEEKRKRRFHNEAPASSDTDSDTERVEQKETPPTND